MPALAERTPARVPEALWRVRLGDAVADLAWTGADSLAAGSADGALVWLDGAGAVRAEAPAAHGGGVTRIRPQPRAGRLASAGEDGCVRLWADDGRAELLAQGPGWIEHLDWSADGQLLAAATGEGIRLWRNGSPLQTWSGGPPVLGLAWAPDGRRLAGAANKGVHLWRLGQQGPERLLAFPGAAVSLGWNRAGSALAAGTQDGFLQVWRRDRRAGARQLTMKGYPGKVSCLTWDPRRDAVATAGGGEVVLWRFFAAGGQRATPLRRHQAAVTALAYAPGGDLLVSGDRAGRLCAWTADGAPLHELDLDGEITALAWSGEGRLAAGTVSGLVQTLHFPGSHG
ncbi:MAG: hypothetical protein PVF91_08000 [Chromatiales bacterium]|jgi:YD repeat-containing protein